MGNASPWWVPNPPRAAPMASILPLITWKQTLPRAAIIYCSLFWAPVTLGELSREQRAQILGCGNTKTLKCKGRKSTLSSCSASKLVTSVPERICHHQSDVRGCDRAETSSWGENFTVWLRGKSIKIQAQGKVLWVPSLIPHR